MALLYGLWYSYSVFLVALLKEFGWSRSVTAGAFSMFALVHAGVGPVLRAHRGAGRTRAGSFSPGGCVLCAAACCWPARTSQPWHLYVAFGFVASHRDRLQRIRSAGDPGPGLVSDPHRHRRRGSPPPASAWNRLRSFPSASSSSTSSALAARRCRRAGRRGDLLAGTGDALAVSRAARR